MPADLGAPAKDRASRNPDIGRIQFRAQVGRYPTSLDELDEEVELLEGRGVEMNRGGRLLTGKILRMCSYDHQARGSSSGEPLINSKIFTSSPA